MIAARIARIGSGFAFRGWHLIASALPSQHRAFSKTPTRMVVGVMARNAARNPSCALALNCALPSVVQLFCTRPPPPRLGS